MADGFAGWAATIWCLPPAVVTEVAALDLKTRLVHDRLAYVTSTFGSDVEYPNGQDGVEMQVPVVPDVVVGTEVVGESEAGGEVDAEEGLEEPVLEEDPDRDLEDESFAREWCEDDEPVGGSGALGPTAAGQAAIGLQEVVARDGVALPIVGPASSSFS